MDTHVVFPSDSLVPLSVSSHFPGAAVILADLCHHGSVLPVLEFHINEIIPCVLFFPSWLLLLRYTIYPYARKER